MQLVRWCCEDSTPWGELWSVSHKLSSKRKARGESSPWWEIMGQDANLSWAGILLLEVLTFGNEIKHFPITVTKRLSQIFSIMLRRILWSIFSLGPMELHSLGSKLALCMFPIRFTRITDVQGIWIELIQWFLKYKTLITICFLKKRTEDDWPCNPSFLLYLFYSSPPWCLSVLPAFTQTWLLVEHTLAKLSCGIIAVTGAPQFRGLPYLLLLTR